MRVNVATKWSELNDWQLGELSHLFFTSEDGLSSRAFDVISILFRRDMSLSSRVRLGRLLGRVPLSVLWGYAGFFGDMPDCYRFPSVGGLSGPGDRLSMVSIEQFSIADRMFYDWYIEQEEVNLRRLVASLYSLGNFDVLRLSEVADYTDRLPIKIAYAIGMCYFASRTYITDLFPVVFPKKDIKKADEVKPTFRKQSAYVPFSKVITAMIMDESQPLGPLDKCKETNMYDFFGVLSESILRVNRQNKVLVN